MNYRFPQYISDCTNKVEQQVQTQIDTMINVSHQCESSNPTGKINYDLIQYVDNKCIVEDENLSYLTLIFQHASDIIKELENDWALFRDDAKGKLSQLSSNVFLVNQGIYSLYGTFYDNHGYQPIFENMYNFTFKIQGSRIMNPALSEFQSVITKMNNLIRAFIDTVILNAQSTLGQLISVN